MSQLKDWTPPDPGNEEDRFEFVDPDIEGITATVKHMEIVDFSKGYGLYFNAKNNRWGQRERMRLLKLASEKFAKASLSAPNNFITLYRWGSVYILQAK